MKNLFLLALIGSLGMTGCARAIHIRSAYISPSGPCGYVVMLGDPAGNELDPQLSRCLPIDQSRAIADQINTTMADKWSGTPNP